MMMPLMQKMASPLPLASALCHLATMAVMMSMHVELTVTKPSTVTSITTSIHIPDGTLARTDGSSAVIYKIVKMNNAPLSILNDFVKPGKKGEKKK